MEGSGFSRTDCNLCRPNVPQMWRVTGSMYPTGSPAGARATSDTLLRPLPEWRDPVPFDTNGHAIIVSSSCLGFENGLPALTIRFVVHIVGVRRTVPYETSGTARLDLDDQQNPPDLIAVAFSIVFLIFNSVALGVGRAEARPGGMGRYGCTVCAGAKANETGATSIMCHDSRSNPDMAHWQGMGAGLEGAP